nr:zf-CCHC domain-containing protein/UBN2 domain-containing protein [Tanacetum cinerariifolium]
MPSFEVLRAIAKMILKTKPTMKLVAWLNCQMSVCGHFGDVGPERLRLVILSFLCDDKEYAMAVRNFKRFFRRNGKIVRQPREEKKSFRQRDEKKGKSEWKCFRCGDPNHLIDDCPKPSRNKDQNAFIRVLRAIAKMIMKTKPMMKLVAWLNRQMRVLHDIASSLEMDYLPKRRWSKLDKKRSRIMINAIDQQLFEKRVNEESREVCWREIKHK